MGVIDTRNTTWTSYTPTFTGFGTVANINIYSRKVGDSIEIQGFFQTGTCTATEAQMTLGFNGSNANITTNTNSSGILGVANEGSASTTFFGASIIAAATNQSYIRFGRQTSTGSELTAVNGNAFANSTFINVNFKVKILGWS